jgi:hypothetical protein
MGKIIGEPLQLKFSITRQCGNQYGGNRGKEWESESEKNKEVGCEEGLR